MEETAVIERTYWDMNEGFINEYWKAIPKNKTLFNIYLLYEVDVSSLQEVSYYRNLIKEKMGVETDEEQDELIEGINKHYLGFIKSSFKEYTDYLKYIKE